jgi:DNA-nicking Smr family endonuclease
MTWFSVKRGKREPKGMASSGDGSAPSDAAVVLPIGDLLDLHPFDPREVGDLVDDYLDEARAAGLRELRIVHGRGSGSLRERVRRRLARRSDVESFGDAPEEWARKGATVVRLRPPATGEGQEG